MKTDLYSYDGFSLATELKNLASDASPSCAIICDMEQKSSPVIFATNEFYRVTGYRPDEVIGQNCRFLQGWNTDKRDIEEIRDAIAERRQVSLEILNYTKRGDEVLNSLYLSPCFDDSGKMVRYLGYQTFCTREAQSDDALYRVILPLSGCRVSLQRYSKGGFHSGYRTEPGMEAHGTGR